jgi:hypothetical protein
MIKDIEAALKIISHGEFHTSLDNPVAEDDMTEALHYIWEFMLSKLNRWTMRPEMALPIILF